MSADSMWNCFRAKLRTQRRKSVDPASAPTDFARSAARFGWTLLRRFCINAGRFVRSVNVQRRVRRLQLQDRLVLGNKQSVALFRIDDQEFVIGCCADNMVLLGTMDAKKEVATQPPTAEQLTQQFVQAFHGTIQ